MATTLPKPEPATARESAAPLTPRPWRAALALCWREIVRFLRQRNRIVSAVGQPILFWLLFSVGFSRSFNLGGGAADGGSFQQYYFPGTLVLILLFTAIFATISVIEDRKEGFLQSVLVAPIPRWSMVLGKVLGGSALAMLQGLIFLCLALTLKVETSLVAIAALVVLMLVTSMALTSVGMVIAWRMDSTQGYHAVMSLVLMPMWLLSGAFFPIPALTADTSWAQIVMHWGMKLNPLSYSVAGVRQLLFAGPPPEAFWAPNLVVCWSVAIAFAVISFTAAVGIAGQRTRGDLL
ncbi:MAG: ABC transporter permease [Pirellulaceae bacterium]